MSSIGREHSLFLVGKKVKVLRGEFDRGETGSEAGKNHCIATELYWILIARSWLALLTFCFAIGYC